MTSSAPPPVPRALQPRLLDNPGAQRVRRVRALARRNTRAKEGRFVVEGPQGVREAVAWRPDLVDDVYVDPRASERHADIVDAALAAGLYVHEATDEVLAAMSDTQAPQGVLAVVRVLDVSLDHVLDHLGERLARQHTSPHNTQSRASEPGRPPLLVLLAAVRDPGNAGTVLRGADAMGADAVLVGRNSVDLYNPKVVRSTAGSLFHLPIVTGLDVVPTLARLRAAGIVSYAADGAGNVTIGESDLTRPHAWVMGNEAWGLPDEMAQVCDQVVRIPLHRAESLNLAMAATICLYASATA